MNCPHRRRGGHLDPERRSDYAANQNSCSVPGGSGQIWGCLLSDKKWGMRVAHPAGCEQMRMADSMQLSIFDYLISRDMGNFRPVCYEYSWERRGREALQQSRTGGHSIRFKTIHQSRSSSCGHCARQGKLLIKNCSSPTPCSAI